MRVLECDGGGHERDAYSSQGTLDGFAGLALSSRHGKWRHNSRKVKF